MAEALGHGISRISKLKQRHLTAAPESTDSLGKRWFSPRSAAIHRGRRARFTNAIHCMSSKADVWMSPTAKAASKDDPRGRPACTDNSAH
jgi:hypothetical protein